MPKITQFDAPDSLGLRPTEVGISATAAAARRVGSEYSEAAGSIKEMGQHYASTVSILGEFAVKYADHQQISAGAAESIKLLDQLQKSKDGRIANLDATDPGYGIAVEAIGKDWRENTLEPALQRFKSGFTTENSQKWAENFVQKTREHMFHQTASETSSASGIGVSNSIKTISNISSNLALRRPDQVEMLVGKPAADGQPAVRGKIDTDIDAIIASSNLRGVQAAKARTDLTFAAKKATVEAGAIGAIQKSADPEATAQEYIGKYPEYIDGHKAVILATNARQQIRAREYDDRQSEARIDKAKKEASSDAANQYLIDVRSQDPRLAKDPVAQRILNDPYLTKTDRSNLLNLIDRQLKPETDTRTSNDTMISFLKEMRPGAGDVDERALEQRLWDARTKDPGTPGSLNEAHFEKLRKELVERKTPEGMALSTDRNAFLSTFGARIDGGMVGATHSAAGKQKMAAVKEDLDRRETEMRRAGKDPRDLYRSNSPDYYDIESKMTNQHAVSFQDAVNFQFSIGQSPGKGALGTRTNPIVIPEGTTPEQLQTMGIKTDMWVLAPGSKTPRQAK